MFSNFFLILPTIGALLADAAPLVAGGPKCSEISLPVTVSANNKVISPDASIATLADLNAAVGTILGNAQNNLVTGTFNIRGRYCAPQNDVAARRHTLQVLVHGITYTRNYWSGSGNPGFDGTKYSWIDKASEEGYPTLSIDRLGNGLSDHPDPITTVQLPLQVEVLSELIKLARGGAVGGKSFAKIIYVGHSYGSLIGNALTTRHPTAADAMLLTGFSQQIHRSLTGVVVTGMPLPAAVIGGEKYHEFAVGYTLVSSQPGRRSLYVSGTPGQAYDEEYYQFDRLQNGTVTVGEAVSAFETEYVSREFKGDVFVLNGRQDNIFCSLALQTSHPDCTHIVPGVQKLYPSAKSFGYKLMDNTGHCISLQYSAQQSFKIAHNWMAQKGY